MKQILLVRIFDHDTNTIDGAVGDIIDFITTNPGVSQWEAWDGVAEFWRKSGRVHLFIPIENELSDILKKNWRTSAHNLVGWAEKELPEDKDIPITTVTAKYKYYIRLEDFNLSQDDLKKVQDPKIWHQPLMLRWREKSLEKHYLNTLTDVRLKSVVDDIDDIDAGPAPDVVRVNARTAKEMLRG